MPEERTAPSAGWRAVYAAMGASTSVEGEEPRRRPRPPDSRARSRDGDGDASGTGSTPASVSTPAPVSAPESAETDGGVVRLDAWTAREVDVDAVVDAVADADVDAEADADGRRPERGDRSTPLRGEVP